MQQYYNVHGIVGIKINHKNPYVIEELDYSLRHFKVEVSPVFCDIEVRDLVDFVLPEGSFNVSSTIFGFKNGILKKDESYAVVLEGGAMILYVKENNLCINTFIEYFLLKKGFTFIHGACVAYKNAGILFPAPPNTGKTTLMSKLREKKDIIFFGDDYTIIKNDGTLYSYPMDFSIHDYHFNFYKELQSAPEGKKIKKMVYEKVLVGLVRNFPIRKTLKRVAAFFHYDFLKGGEYLKVPAARLMGFEKIGSSASFEYCVYLNKYNGREFRFEKITMETVVKEILGTLQTEWHKTMPVYHYLASFGIIDFAEHIRVIQEVLEKSLRNVQCYRIFLPDDMEHQERFRQLDAFLEREIFSHIE